MRQLSEGKCNSIEWLRNLSHTFHETNSSENIGRGSDTRLYPACFVARVSIIIIIVAINRSYR